MYHPVVKPFRWGNAARALSRPLLCL